MAQVHRLQPHDAVPESGCFVLVLRRFGEDAPDVAITEIIVSAGADRPEMTAAIRPDGSGMGIDEAIGLAVQQADDRQIREVYAVDRTAGPREREVLVHGGDHSVDMNRLDDATPGETGTDLHDRPRDAGYNLTPRR